MTKPDMVNHPSFENLRIPRLRAPQMTFGTYDFETYDWTKPLCADLYDGSNHTFILDRQDPFEVSRSLLLEMESSVCSEWWAHNGGKYDALFLVDAVRSLKGWKADGAVAAGRLISLRIITPHHCFTLKDSYAVIQASLDKALESFEIPHKKVFTKADYASLDTDKRGMRKFSNEKLKLGCQADTEALHALVSKAEEMFVEWGGQLKSTFSASALTVVKASVAESGRELPSHEGQQEYNDIGRKAFCGGRVEVFRHTPQGLLNEYDVTSSYPWSMAQELPWELVGYAEPDLSRSQLVYAKVNVPFQFIPPLPYVPPTGGLFFPWGEWSGWFTSIELEDAIQNCRVKATIHDAVEYTTEQPFTNFIDKVFKVKATATGARREFAKLVMNGCYGKFAQKPENSKLRMFDNKRDALEWAHTYAIDKPDWMLPEPLNDSQTAWTMKTLRWPKQTHYAIASFITARSRILLRKHLQSADGLAYCDTDSIHCGGTLATNKKLGGLKLEMERYSAKFYAPKLYELHPEGKESEHYRPPDKDDRYKPTYASKGFPVSPEAFARIVKGELVGNPKGRMQLLKTQLRKDKGVKHLSEKDTEKKWSGFSNKRKLANMTIRDTPEGTTEPWHVRELHNGDHETQKSPLAPLIALAKKTRKK